MRRVSRAAGRAPSARRTPAPCLTGRHPAPPYAPGSRETGMRIGIVGCAGRMGRTNLREVLETDGAELAGGVERPGHPALGQDLGVLAGLDPVGVAASDDLDALLAAADAGGEVSTPPAPAAPPPP